MLNKLLILAIILILPFSIKAQKSCNFVALNQVDIEDVNDTTISGYFRINDYLLDDGAVKFGLKAEFSPMASFKYVKLYSDSLCTNLLLNLTMYILPNDNNKVEGNFSYIFPLCDTTYRVFLKFRLFDTSVYIYPLNVKLSTSVDIDQKIREEKINIFPNPVSETLYINAENNQKDLKRLYNLQGKLLIETMDNNIDFRNFSRGMYIIEINGNSNKVIKL